MDTKLIKHRRMQRKIIENLWYTFKTDCLFSNTFEALSGFLSALAANADLNALQSHT